MINEYAFTLEQEERIKALSIELINILREYNNGVHSVQVSAEDEEPSDIKRDKLMWITVKMPKL